MSELSLFPLSAVLLPFGRVPLKIFEQRYLDLVRESMKTDNPFGVVWIRHGGEIEQRGRAAPKLGDYGTCARIVDWDQLSNGLLGITVEGIQRFELYETHTRSNGLVVGQVALQKPTAATHLAEQWSSLLDILRTLETHPHVQRMNLHVDYNDAWQVGYTLLQLLPLEESVKYKLLVIDNIEELMSELHLLLNQISGED